MPIEFSIGPSMSRRFGMRRLIDLVGPERHVLVDGELGLLELLIGERRTQEDSIEPH